MKTRTVVVTLAFALLVSFMLAPGLAFAQGQEGAPGPAVKLAQALNETAAQTLGMETSAYMHALRAGATPADLAANAGVSVETLSSALQETWNAAGVKLIDLYVMEGPPRPRHPVNCRRQAHIAHRWVSVSAETLGMELGEFLEALHAGNTPAQIAEAHFSSGQALVDAIVAAEADILAQAVADGKLTQEQADDILAHRTELAQNWVENGENGMSERCKRLIRITRHWIHLGAETVGIPEKEFAKALYEGQTPAEIAEANGSSGQAIIDAIVADAQTRLDQAVADGKLTPEEAASRLAEITEKATNWVENGWPDRDDRSEDQTVA